ncbi:unnamed protein product [Malus baccata var. baccata]
MRKLLEFDFSTAIDGTVKDKAAKIRVIEVEVSDERHVKCKSGCCPLTICCLVDLQAFDLSNYMTFSHWRAYPDGLGWHEPHGKIGMAGSHNARLA